MTNRVACTSRGLPKSDITIWVNATGKCRAIGSINLVEFMRGWVSKF
jgi:hypothetical protein